MVTNQKVDVSLYPDFRKTVMDIIDECDAIMSTENSSTGWKATRLHNVFKKYDML